METPTISRVTATAVNMPALWPCAWSGGTYGGTTRSIVEVEASDGTIGLGESPGADAAGRIAHRIGERVRGISVFDRNMVRRVCLGTHADFAGMFDNASSYAFAAIEMALWDITAKRLGVPLFRALGGEVRERAPFCAYAYSIEERGAEAEKSVPGRLAEFACNSISRTGSRLFEFKVGRHSVECDIATVHAVRAALGPDVEIGVDANLAYTVDQARRFLAGTKDANLSNIEEPVASLADMDRLRRDFGVPISTHCTNFEQLAAYPSIDSTVGDLHGDGGISANLVIAEIAGFAGRRYWLRSHSELGIAFAAFCHVGMVSPAMDRPAQCLIDWIEHPLTLGDKWAVTEGGVRPPDKPGLGIDLDRAALREYARRHEVEGALTYYDRP